MTMGADLAQARCISANAAAWPAAAFSTGGKAARVKVAGIWRADGAADLCAQLGLDEAAEPANVIAAGWQAWGTALADRLSQNLTGPFAIAVFDAEAQSLYCARDALGVEPLFVARTPGRIAAAHCPRTARRAAQLASTPDRAMIADFVEGELSSTTATFHEGLTRVAPGHWRLISRDADQSEAYWSLSAIPECEPVRSPADQVRDKLAREIKAGGGTGEGVAVPVSGGLDSSAVAAITADIRENPRDVTTLSLTYDGNPGWVDGPYIAAMRGSLAMDHRSLPSTGHDPFAEIDEVLQAMDGPCFGYGVSVSTSLFAFAKAHGLRTVLHGHGGDEIISYGVGRLNELARGGEWRTLWREAEGAAGLSGQSKWAIFKRYLVHRPKYRWLKQRWSKLFAPKPAMPEKNAETGILAAALAPHKSRTDGDQRPLQQRPEHSERDLHIAALEHPVQPHALETIALTGRYYGLNIAMPFMSRELAQLCVSLPSHWKLRGGYTRYVLREAIRPLVPASIANRRDKNDFTQDFIGGLIASPFARQYADPGSPALTQYVNSQWLHENWAKVDHLGRDISIATARGLWRAAVLGYWLAMDRDAGILDSSEGQAPLI